MEAVWATGWGGPFSEMGCVEEERSGCGVGNNVYGGDVSGGMYSKDAWICRASGGAGRKMLFWVMLTHLKWKLWES